MVKAFEATNQLRNLSILRYAIPSLRITSQVLGRTRLNQYTNEHDTGKGGGYAICGDQRCAFTSPHVVLHVYIQLEVCSCAAHIQQAHA